MAERFTNNPSTTLAVGMASSDTTIQLVSAAGFPTQAEYRLRVEDEIMLVTEGAGTTAQTVTRGVEQTAAVAHPINAPVKHPLTAGSLAQTIIDAVAPKQDASTAATDIELAAHAANPSHTDARTPTAHDHPQVEVTSLTTDLAAKQPISEKGQANGYAGLDNAGKVQSSALPAISLVDVNTVVSEAAQLALAAQEGDLAIRTDQSRAWVHNGGTAGTMADWTELATPVDQVLSVAGKTGVVTLVPSDAGAQPLNSDLTDIADLTTTTYGRALLEQADAAAARTVLGVGSGGVEQAAFDALASQVGTSTINSSGDVQVEFFTPWGMKSSGDVYWDEDGATAGEEAIMRPDDNGTFGLVGVGRLNT